MQLFSLLLLLVFVSLSSQVKACNYTLAIPDRLSGNTSLFQALDIIENQQFPNCLMVFSAGDAEDVFYSVNSGHADSGLLPIGYFDEFRIGYFDEFRKKFYEDWMLPSTIGFQFSNASNFWESQSDVDPIDLGNSDVKAQLAVPLGITMGMWNSGWDGQFPAESIEYHIVTQDQGDNFSNYSKSFSKPIGFRPYILIYKTSAENRFEEESFQLFNFLGNTLSEILNDQQTTLEMQLRGQGVDFFDPPQSLTHDLPELQRLTHDLRELDSSYPFEINSLIYSPHELESLTYYLRELMVPNLQCARGTCPCPGQNVCSDRCCPR